MGAESNWWVTASFVTYMVGVFALGLAAHKLLSRGAFLGQYFLGGKNLGAWTLALTFASTSASGGSFTGFPALIYSQGWIMVLWIASYMMVPIVTMGVLGRRLNQLGHTIKALTIPDVFRDRFQSDALGMVSTLFIMSFLTFNLVGQFVAGGRIMSRVMGWETTAYIEQASVELRDEVIELSQSETGTEISITLTARDAAGGDSVRTVTATDVNELKSKDARAYDLYREYGQENSWGYVAAVIIFSLVVVAYTAYGGFWAVVWTDVFQGIWMVVGVLIMLPVALYLVGGLGEATRTLAERDPGLVFGPGVNDFHPVGLMISYFIMWSIVGMGQPASMWRLMAFKNTQVLRRSIFMVMVYYSAIYFPLVLIFICARVILPPLGAPDDAMPSAAVTIGQQGLGHVAGSLLGGAIIAAPFAAIMSTVDSFLLLISSCLVRDLYQRSFNPHVSEKAVKRMTYAVTAGIGILVCWIALSPPAFLQYIIVFTGQGLACCLLVPMVLALFWRRSTAMGAMASMLAGFVVFISLYIVGWVGRGMEWLPPQTFGPRTALAPYWLGDLEPVVWGLAASVAAGIVVSLYTKPPDVAWLDRLFNAPASTTQKT